MCNRLPTLIERTNMQTEKTLTLSDGRTLSYAEYGLPGGFPVFFFHGAPSSRLEPMLVGDEMFCQCGLRIIAPDRPGMGRSTFQEGRGFSHWPADVNALADSLKIERFSVFGNSGGGPYAAVCAAKIPERLHSAVITSGAWRMDSPEVSGNLPVPNRMIWILAKRAPFLLSGMIKMMSASSSKPTTDKSLEQIKTRTPPSDFEVLMRPGVKEAFMQMSNESMRQGAKGLVWELRLYVRDWDFQLDEVQMPITLFHGKLDTSVPVALARKAASMLPGARLIVYDQDAHVSTPVKHFDEIAKELVK
jgi:pimeloyl-ACP methyl ester carboxylesterase